MSKKYAEEKSKKKSWLSENDFVKHSVFLRAKKYLF